MSVDFIVLSCIYPNCTSSILIYRKNYIQAARSDGTFNFVFKLPVVVVVGAVIVVGVGPVVGGAVVKGKVVDEYDEFVVHDEGRRRLPDDISKNRV